MAKHSNPYIRWTPEEDAVLKSGGTPPNRTRTQCYTRARKLGLAPPTRRRWTPNEIALLRSGTLPPNRTPSAAYAYCMLHGIEPVSTWRPYLSALPTWTPDELELVRRGVVPPNRTARQCSYASRNLLGVEFVPADIPPVSDADACAIRAVRLSNRGFPLSLVATALGIPLHDLRNWVADLRRAVLRRAKGKTKEKCNV